MGLTTIVFHMGWLNLAQTQSYRQLENSVGMCPM